MKNPTETTTDNNNKALEDDNSKTPTTENGEDEFQLTIKKLEMPVRPRGVLAE
jgi:hypothetical protein